MGNGVKRWKINTTNDSNILLLFSPGNTQKIIGISIWSLFPHLKAEITPILAQLRLEEKILEIEHVLKRPHWINEENLNQSTSLGNLYPFLHFSETKQYIKIKNKKRRNFISTIKPIQRDT